MPRKEKNKPWIDDWGVRRCPECGVELGEGEVSKSQVYCTSVEGERSCCDKAYDRVWYMKNKNDPDFNRVRLDRAKKYYKECKKIKC